LKAVHHILVSSVDTHGGFKTGLDTGDLHRPTWNIAAAFSVKEGAREITATSGAASTATALSGAGRA
jgi:hypothetical protein